MAVPSEHQVDDAKVAAFLVDRAKNKHLEPFLGRECGLAEAAERLGLSKSRMSYWINRLLEFGLIQVVRTEQQKRNRVRIYRSVAECFVVPLELVPAESDEALLESNLDAYWQTFICSLAQAGRKNADGWHLRHQLEGERTWNRIVPRSGDLEQAKPVNNWARLNLTDEQASE